MVLSEIRKALVTGASGFIGGHLCSHLTDLGIETVTVGSPESASRRPHDEANPAPQRPPDFTVDVRDLESLRALIAEVRPTHVFHLAAVRNRGMKPTDVAESVQVNVGGTANVALSGAEAGIDRLVVAGTAEEYGAISVPFLESEQEHPVTTYGISKMLATRAALACGEMTGLAVTAMRISVAYGPGQSESSLLGGLVESMKRGAHFPMSRGEQTRDFIWVGDVAEGLVRSAAAGSTEGEVVNLGSGNAMSVSRAAHIVAEMAGNGGLLGIGELPLRHGEAAKYALSSGKAQELLGWLPPTSFEAGARLMLTAEGL